MLARRSASCCVRPARATLPLARPQLPLPPSSRYLSLSLLAFPARLYGAKTKSKDAPRSGTIRVPVAATVQSTKLPPQTPEDMEQEQKAASQLRSVLETRLKDVNQGKLSPGQPGFYQLYRSVVSYPRWLVPGSLHRDQSINTLFTFSRNDRDRGILPIFSSRPEFQKFVELMKSSAASPRAALQARTYQEECFMMPGTLLFAQLATAVHRTNLERVVVDITVAPAFSIAKSKLETWREWADVISLETALSKVSQPPVSREASERALTALLQFQHFIGVKSLESDRLVRAHISESSGAQSQESYLSLFTALDHLPPEFLDRTKYQLVRAPARQALESCAKQGDAGLVVNMVAGQPLAVLAVRDGRPTTLTPSDSGALWAHAQAHSSSSSSSSSKTSS